MMHDFPLKNTHPCECLAADRAKSIRTQAQVNETSTDKLIQELIAEKERLLSELRLTKAKPLAGYTDEGNNNTSSIC